MRGDIGKGGAEEERSRAKLERRMHAHETGEQP